MDAASAFALLLGAHAPSYTGGAITTILLNTPGDPPNAATLFDGYPMTRKGQAGRALGAALSSSAVGGVLGALYLIALLGDWLFKKESMGGGDVKMAAMLGAFLGWQKVLLVFLGSAVIGLVISLILMGFSAKLRQNRVVPFGPFIALAAVVAIVWGDRLISFYVHHWLLPG